MTTSSPKNLEFLKTQAKNSYIDFTPEEIKAIDECKTFEEFDRLMHELVAKYNEHWKE